MYHNKLKNLLTSAKNYDECPPNKVQFVIGDINPNAPSYRIALYKEKRNTTVVLGYETWRSSERPPRFIIKGISEISRYYQRLFNKEWEHYVSIARNSIEFSNETDEKIALRAVFVNQIASELERVAQYLKNKDEELHSSAKLRSALTHLDSGHAVLMSCPQKVCLSGDYGDMQTGGVTLTAAIAIRPYVIVRKTENSSHTITIKDNVNSDNVNSDPSSWPLVEAFHHALPSDLPHKLHIEIYPSPYIGLGLGSSGSASVLLAATLALAKKETLTTDSLIRRAHTLESELTGWKCGAQDHAAAVLGDLRLFEYPSLSSSRIFHTSSWAHFSFWKPAVARFAREVIPRVFSDHTQIIWGIRAQITRHIVNAIVADNIKDLIEAVRNESYIQKQLEMLTGNESVIVDAIAGHGGAAKVSGAGGGGVLVVVSPSSEAREKLSDLLLHSGYSELPLAVDTAGFTVEHR